LGLPGQHFPKLTSFIRLLRSIAALRQLVKKARKKTLASQVEI
jgi:hypothetical protein